MCSAQEQSEKSKFENSSGFGYTDFTKKEPQMSKLPNLKISKNQLFFFSYLKKSQDQ